MRHLFILLPFLFKVVLASGQLSGFPAFGTDTTFEVMTWNLEGFPKKGQVTMNYVKQILETLDVDLVAIQELDDVGAFEQMVAEMDSFEGYAAPDSYAGLAYIYKKSKIRVNHVYEIYTSNSYWRPFPRAPLVIDLNYLGEQLFVINNHLKCCGDGYLDLYDADDDETRRYNACNLLKEYIEDHFQDQNVIVTGDLNDELTDPQANNVFRNLINDYGNYRFTDMEIAEGPGSGWSYPSWPSHLDHLMITNDLFDEAANPGSVIQTIKAEEFLSGWYEYEDNISDHRPVAMKLSMNFNLGLGDQAGRASGFSNSPNPFSSETRFTFRLPMESAIIEIVNVFGQTVFSAGLAAGTIAYTWNPDTLPPGLYLARLLSRGSCVASRTVVLE